MKSRKTLIQISLEKKIPNLPEKAIKQLIESVIRELKLSAREIHVIFVDDEYLRKLHREYLHDDSYTDVMTFNLSDSGEVEGEIYISVDRARVQARQYQVSVEEEIARLVIHGLLHLKGYDDATPAERQNMHQLENKMLRLFWRDAFQEAGM